MAIVPPTVISMTRGDTKDLTVTVKKNAAALSLVGMTMWMTAKRKVSDADPGVFQKSSPSTGIVFTDAAAGIATVTISPSDTSSLEDDIVNLVCDIQIKDSGGAIKTVASFTLQVKPDVTRTTT